MKKEWAIAGLAASGIRAVKTFNKKSVWISLQINDDGLMKGQVSEGRRVSEEELSWG